MKGLTFRILVAILLVLGTGLALLVRDDLKTVKRHYREAAEETLVDFAGILAAQVAADAGDTLSLSESFKRGFSDAAAMPIRAQIYDLTKTRLDTRVYVTDKKGIVVYDSDNGRDEGRDYSKWLDVAHALKGEYGARSSTDGTPAQGTILYTAVPIRSHGNIIGALSVGKPTENANKLIEDAKRGIVQLGLAIFFLMALVGLILAWLLMRPLEKLTRYARAIGQGKQAILPRFSTPEIQTLAAALEEMRLGLEGKEYVERYVQTLTHELKSPITGIRSAVEILKSEEAGPADRTRFLGNIERESERMRTLIEKLLALARFERKKSMLSAERVSLNEVMEDISESFESSCARKGLTLEIDIPLDCVLCADRFWLTEALRNLITNAADFSPTGETVRVEANRMDDFLLIRVLDNGSGIPDWAFGKIFDRFFSLPRPEGGRKSSGLGLCIIKEVAEAHGGGVTLHRRESGGICAELFLPGDKARDAAKEPVATLA